MTTVSRAGVLNSISQISGGTTIDFDQGGTLGSNVAPYGIAVSGALSTTSLDGRVTGNNDAPISGRGIYFRSGQNTRLLSVKDGWTSIGFSLMSGRTTAPASVVFNAFDAQNNLLVSRVVNTEVDGTFAGLNAGTKFVGFESATPIAAIVIANRLFGRYDSMAIDNLTFVEASPMNAVPEPSTFAFASIGATVLCLRRRRRAP